MKTELNLRVLNVDGGCTDVVFPVKHVFNAGWAGSDREQVELHIDELELLGVARPDRIPECFELSADRVQFSDRIQVLSSETSGEIEYVLWLLGEEVFVGVGSDHTDRWLESVSVPFSKQVYPNIVSKDVWRLDAVKDHWAELVLQCWAHDNGEREVYQEGGVGLLLDPWFWIEQLRTRGMPSECEGVVLMSGTISAKGGLRPSGKYSIRLFDPVTNRSLETGYEVEEVQRSLLDN